MADAFRHMAEEARRTIDVCSIHGVKIQAAEEIVDLAIKSGYLHEVTNAPAANVRPSQEDPKLKAKLQELIERLEAFWKRTPAVTSFGQASRHKELDSLLIGLDSNLMSSK